MVRVLKTRYNDLSKNRLQIEKVYLCCSDMRRIISVNLTVILDSALPYQLDMQFFQSLTTSILSKSANFAMYIMTLPTNQTQLQLDQLVLSLTNYTGPRFVYATYATALGLVTAVGTSFFTFSIFHPVRTLLFRGIRLKMKCPFLEK